MEGAGKGKSTSREGSGKGQETGHARFRELNVAVSPSTTTIHREETSQQPQAGTHIGHGGLHKALGWSSGRSSSAL